jgi:hypothetical protein
MGREGHTLEGLTPAFPFQGKPGILDYIRRVGCIQFDPLRSAGRMPTWSCRPGYAVIYLRGELAVHHRVYTRKYYD